MKRICITLVCLLSLPIAATEKIKDAFGISLGSIFNPENALSAIPLSNGKVMYQITPTNSFKYFSDYFVYITPKTHKVYSIVGVGYPENKESCNQEQSLVMDILVKKYGPIYKDSKLANRSHSKFIFQDSAHVSTSCTMKSRDTYLDITYTAQELQKLAEAERVKIEKNKLDSSGL